MTSDEWIDVKDRLPEVDIRNRYYGDNGLDRQPFVPVLFYAGGCISGVCAGRYFPPFGRRKRAVWFSLQGRRIDTGATDAQVTHWAPMPDPPRPASPESEGGR